MKVSEALDAISDWERAELAKGRPWPEVRLLSGSARKALQGRDGRKGSAEIPDTVEECQTWLAEKRSPNSHTAAYVAELLTALHNI